MRAEATNIGDGRPVEIARDGLTIVAMSGGVDSALAAALLARQGRRVIGVSLRLYDSSREGGAGGCCSPEDFRDARLVAGRLGIPYYVLDHEKEFGEAVLSRFLSEYRQGRTPSPCVSCNTELKFGALMRYADEIGAARIATGHYARIRGDARTGLTLHAAVDGSKDQSYFLFELEQSQLVRAEFPVGELTKTEVRALAREMGLPVAEKPESQDICFVPGGDYRSVLERDGGGLGRPGRFVDRGGRVLGAHGGVAGFTVGQRRGLGIASSEPLYVIAVDGSRGDVTVGPGDALRAGGLIARGWRWISGRAPAGPVRGTVRIRHRHAGAPATVTGQTGIGTGKDGTVRVRFGTPQRAVAPGQAAVLYDGTRVLGGGWIESALPPGDAEGARIS